MPFTDFLDGLNPSEVYDYEIDGYHISDFMTGSSDIGRVKTKVFEHIPMDIHFGIKHKNRGKIESHLWFFEGFCNYLNPQYCFILDAGTAPLWKSLSRIVFHFEINPQLGGAAGEIEVMCPKNNEDGSQISFYQDVLIMGQYVEYKLSHYLDKATESFFGFVSVLPGAFSGFRWKAIKGEPLKQFLKGQSLFDSDKNSFPHCAVANMYLAEDRIMCLEIVAKQNNNYLLHYLPGCKALTDPAMGLIGMMKQRRRWMNGSMFASFHVLKNMCKIWERKNSFLRNIMFSALYIYM